MVYLISLAFNLGGQNLPVASIRKERIAIQNSVVVAAAAADADTGGFVVFVVGRRKINGVRWTQHLVEMGGGCCGVGRGLLAVELEIA